MSEPGSRHDVGQLARQTGIGGGLRILVDLWLLRRLTAKERSLVGVLPMDQRNKAQVVQLFLAPVGDGNFGWTLQDHIAFVGFKVDGRQSFDQSSTFNPAN